MEKYESLLKLHEEFIEGTERNEYVRVFSIRITQVTQKIRKAIKAETSRIYLTSKSLKHIYDRYHHDKKQKEIYFFIMQHIHEIVGDPDSIQQNTESKKKKAQVVFIKQIDGTRYACPINVEKIRKGKRIIERLYIVSCFKLKSGGLYLSKTSTLYQK